MRHIFFNNLRKNEVFLIKCSFFYVSLFKIKLIKRHFYLNNFSINITHLYFYSNANSLMIISANDDLLNDGV